MLVVVVCIAPVYIFHKSDSVARPVALGFVLQWLLLEFIVKFYGGPFFLGAFSFGLDFRYFFDAAGHWLAGYSPYLERNFMPLPPALYLPAALHPLGLAGGFLAFQIVSATVAVGAMFWLCRQLQLTPLNTVLMMLITFSYGPFYSVLAGGNLDALMLALIIAACGRRPVLRAAFLGASIATKFYTVLLLPVFALRRRWRELLGAVTFFAILLLPFAPFLAAGASSILYRTTALRLIGNQSPAILFIFLFGIKHVWAWRTVYALLWGGTLVLRLVKDVREQTEAAHERFRALDYLPWMASAPIVVFYYTGTILLPVMACLIRSNQVRRLSWAEWTCVGGFFITGLYPWVFVYLSPIADPKIYQMAMKTPMLLAAFGVTAMLVGSAFSRSSLAADLSEEQRGTLARAALA